MPKIIRLALQLPNAVIVTTLTVDRELPVAKYLQGWVGDLAARFHYGFDSRIDVIHKPIRSNNRLFIVAQGRSYPDKPTIP